MPAQIKNQNLPEIALIMGSKNDLPLLEGAINIFDKFDIKYMVRVMSAHRTPGIAAEFASNAEANGIKVLICAAGMAAHLAGAMAANSTLPVIGIPIPSEPFNALDSLLATVQMPPGIPVATVTAGKAGAINSVLFAISILALNNHKLAEKLKQYRAEQTEKAIQADQEVIEKFNK